MSETIVSFSEVLKKLYSADLVQELIAGERYFFRVGDFGSVVAGPVDAPGVALSPAGVVALTTLAGLEWLRHRKAEVARAEESGDYSSLVAEFCEWLRGIFRMWRESAGR